MLTLNTPLQLLLLLTIFTLHSFAHQPCSSLKFATPMSPVSLDNLSHGCSIEPQDYFQLEFPFTHDPLETHYSLYFTSNSHQNLIITLISNPTIQTLNLEITTPDENDRHSIPVSHDSTLLLTITNRLVTISLIDFSIILSHNLTGSFPYIFSTKPSSNKNSPLKTTHAFRFLDQCPEGYVLLEGTCGKVCPAKQFNSAGVCERCPDKCYTGRCISSTTCNPCKATEIYHTESDTCLEKCPTSYFEDYNNKICVRCSEGCASCSFPYGTCGATYFKSDMIINLIVSLVLLSLITLCACFCNKDTTEANKNAEQQQPEQTDAQNAEGATKGKSNHIKKVIGVDPKAPYLVLPEGFDSEEHEQERNEGEFPGRKKRKRLTEYAESKLLSVSLSKRGFMIDDADEEKAISHGSATLMGKGIGSFSSLTNSPLFPTKRRSSKGAQPSAFQASGKGKSQVNVDETTTPKQNSYGEVTSPFSVASALVAKKETSLGTLNNGKKEATLYLDTPEEENQQEINVKLDIQFGKSPLELPGDDEKTQDVVQEAEEIDEMDEEEKKEKEGYENDTSLSMTKDGEGGTDMYACTICGMNRRDCLNRPCGHCVGCYACMEQFKESYGVCPRCKKLLVSIEKVGKGSK